MAPEVGLVPRILRFAKTYEAQFPGNQGQSETTLPLHKPALSLLYTDSLPYTPSSLVRLPPIVTEPGTVMDLLKVMEPPTVSPFDEPACVVEPRGWIVYIPKPARP